MTTLPLIQKLCSWNSLYKFSIVNTKTINDFTSAEFVDIDE